ncbi:hypothetical protein EO081_04985 [Sphingomonas desiccabilis]|uniref:Uncharacterized protein n=1 Tax=Sphingomonas desiccabilis TaxID=429134 RepID=A0A4Q2J1T7_9SPHN|nr:hypothetical protein EO081_04985 [Sphingomonas desiccabilis]
MSTTGSGTPSTHSKQPRFIAPSLFCYAQTTWRPRFGFRPVHASSPVGEERCTPRGNIRGAGVVLAPPAYRRNEEYEVHAEIARRRPWRRPGDDRPRRLRAGANRSRPACAGPAPAEPHDRADGHPHDHDDARQQLWQLGQPLGYAPGRADRGRQNDWYRHVRACQQRHRSYNAGTDSYTVRPGVTRRCTL